MQVSCKEVKLSDILIEDTFFFETPASRPKIGMIEIQELPNLMKNKFRIYDDNFETGDETIKIRLYETTLQPNNITSMLIIAGAVSKCMVLFRHM